MAYKDPQKQKAAARESMRALRARRKLEQLKSPAAGARPAPGPAPEGLSPDGLTQSAWAAKLVSVGVAFVCESERILSTCPKDAIALANAGAALVNSNCQWAAEERPNEENSRFGLVPDGIMLDPEYMDLHDRLLARQTEWQLDHQAKLEARARRESADLETSGVGEGPKEQAPPPLPPGGFLDDDEDPTA